MIKGFKNFLMRDDVIVVALGLVVALAFSNLVEAFTTHVVNPMVAAAQPNSAYGLGVQLGAEGNDATFMNLGELLSAFIYFLVFMAVIYFLIVMPYKHIQARRGKEVFGDEAPTKTCPECLSAIDPAARKCKFCASLQSA